MATSPAQHRHCGPRAVRASATILLPPGQQPSVPANGQKPLHVITRSRWHDEQQARRDRRSGPAAADAVRVAAGLAAAGHELEVPEEADIQPGHTDEVDLRAAANPIMPMSRRVAYTR
jgi:hypothetical protein